MNKSKMMLRLTQLTIITMIYLSLPGYADASTAKSSRQIEGPSDFMFNTFHTSLFDISVFPRADEEDGFSKVSVSAVNPAVQRPDDPLIQNREKLFTARPDRFGRIYQQIAVPVHVKKLLIETLVDGESIQVLRAYDGQETVSVVLDQ